MYRNEKDDCHYRDFKAITDNLSRIFSLSCPTLIGHLSRIKKEIKVMPVLPEGKIQGIFKLNKRIGRSLEKIFKKIFRDDSFVFVLTAILFFGALSEVRAECLHQFGECKTWNPGVENNCGQGCTYTYENGTVYIKSQNATMDKGALSPDSFENNSFPAGVSIKNIVIDGNIKLKEHSLYNSHAKVSGADGTLTLTGIGFHAFGHTTIESDIIVPYNANIDTIALYNATINGKIYCAVENCAEVLRESCRKHGGVVAENCLTQIEPLLSNSDKFEQAPKGCDMLTAKGCKCSGSRLMQERVCVDKCGESFKLNDGECDRIHYTPAEAAAVLHDDNTNSVTITFKK